MVIFLSIGSGAILEFAQLLPRAEILCIRFRVARKVWPKLFKFGFFKCFLLLNYVTPRLDLVLLSVKECSP